MRFQIHSLFRKHPRGTPTLLSQPTLLVFTYPTGGRGYGEQIAVIEKMGDCPIHVDIVKTWDQLEYAAMYGVMYVPTTILLDTQYQVVSVNEDVIEADELRAQVARALTSHRTTLPEEPSVPDS